jgi:hypothetical protein
MTDILCYRYETNQFETTFYCQFRGPRPDRGIGCDGWRPYVTIRAGEMHDEIVQRLCNMFSGMGFVPYNGADRTD